MAPAACGSLPLRFHLTGYDHARQRKPDPKAFAVGILALIEAFKDMGKILREKCPCRCPLIIISEYRRFRLRQFRSRRPRGCVPCSSSQYCRWPRSSMRDLPESAVRMDEQCLPRSSMGMSRVTQDFEQLLQTDLLLLELHRAASSVRSSEVW